VPRSSRAARPVVAAHCAGLVKFYAAPSGETQALRGVEAVFASRSMTAISGPSGSGKSTLLAILALRERQSGGALVVSGTDVGALSPSRLRRLRAVHVGWAAQRPVHSMFPSLRSVEQIEQAAANRGCPVDPADALERVGLEARGRARLGELSGGEQQRLAVAAATVGAPTLIVVDEPTADLDDDSAALVLSELRRCAAAGSAVVLATHDVRAMAGSDRVLRLRHGVLAGETGRDGRRTASIDSAGRLQLPPEALALFPDGRAVVVLDDAAVTLRPTGEDE
jgi:putative ABC transport system ATP-binding protein